MTTKLFRMAVLVWLGAAFLVSTGFGEDDVQPIQIADVKHDGDVDFEKEVLPILRKKCLACHNASDAESDLVLENPATIKTGGTEGPAVVAGKSSESLLLHVGAFMREPYMPPMDNDVGAKPLTPDELGLIKLWIDQGAKGEVLGSAAQVAWQPLPQGVNPIYSVAITPDGQFAAAGRANQIFMYHVPSKRELGRLTDPELVKLEMFGKPGVAHLDIVQSLAFNPAGDLLASGGYQTIKLWRRQQNVHFADIAGLNQPVKSMAVSADGHWLAAGLANGEVKLFDLDAQAVKHTLAGHAGEVRGVAFNSTATQLVSGGQDKTYRIWSVAEGKAVGDPVVTPAEINAVAFVAEDKQVATGHQDNQIRTWSTEPVAAEPVAEEGQEPSGPQPLKELAGHGGPITSLAALANESNQLISGSMDSTLRHWDVTNGNQIRQFSHGGPVVSVAARTDGARFASASDNQTAKLWDASNGQQVAELKGDISSQLHVESLRRAVALGQRKIDIAKKDVEEAKKRKQSEEDNQKKAMETRTKAEAEFKTKDEAAKKPIADKEAADKELEAAQEKLTKAEEAKTAATDAFTKADEELKAKQAARDEANKGDNEDAKKKAEDAFKAAEEARKKAEDEKKNAEQEFAKAENEFKQLENKVKQLAGPYQKAVDEKNAAERALKAAERSITRAEESVKKATEAIPVVEASLKQAEEAKTQREAEFQEAEKQASEQLKPYRFVAFSPDGATLATANDGQVVHTWDSTTGAAITSYSGQGGPISGLGLNHQNRHVSTAANNTVVVWDRGVEWKLERVIGSVDSPEILSDRVTALTFSSNGKWLASGAGEPSRSGQLKIWNVDDGNLVKEIAEAHSDTIFALQFSPDDSQIASCAADRFMKVHDIDTGKLYKSFEGHTHHVLGVGWSADGLLLASSGADKVIKVWEYRTGDQKRTIQGFKKEITAVRFVGQTNNIVASCGDKQVYMKNADNGGNVRNYGGAQDYVYSVGVSDDGGTIIAGGADSVVRIWQENGQALATFEAPTPETAQTAAAQ